MTSPIVTDAELDQDRAEAEALMRDTCVVAYKTGRMAQDPITHREVPEYESRFTSKCKVQENSLANGDQNVGGRREVTATYQVHLPWDVDAVETDDRITITAIGSRTPARLLNAVFYVGSDHVKTSATATRLQVRSQPGEAS